MANDEKAARRPEFAGGTEVVLADGQTWVLPRPVVVFVPADTEIGFEVRARLGDDGKFSRLLKALDDAETGAETIGRSLAVGRYLLLMNYDLTPDQVADLLQFNFADEGTDGYRIREQVMAVAWGQGESLPKPVAGT